MRYCFDIDGTLCHTPNKVNGKPDYHNAIPFPWMVRSVNNLYNQGHHIIMMTARGRGSGIDHTDLTRNQLEIWGYKYHELEPMFHKPTADLFIDDKGIEANQWAVSQPKLKGIVAGAFDVIHPGYVRMFADAKKYCNHLTIALHVDPSIERSHKLKPVQSREDRKEILLGMRNVDNVVFYTNEDEYLAMLESGEYDTRFLGEDYSDGGYSGVGLDIPISWLPRKHMYSSTKLKTLICLSINSRK